MTRLHKNNAFNFLIRPMNFYLSMKHIKIIDNYSFIFNSTP